MTPYLVSMDPIVEPNGSESWRVRATRGGMLRRLIIGGTPTGTVKTLTVKGSALESDIRHLNAPAEAYSMNQPKGSAFRVPVAVGDIVEVVITGGHSPPSVWLIQEC